MLDYHAAYDLLTENLRLTAFFLIALVIAAAYPQVAFIILASLVNMAAFSHKRFFKFLPISLEVSPIIAIIGYSYFGFFSGLFAGLASVFCGIIFSNTYHVWNFFRLIAVLAILLILELSGILSVHFYFLLIIFYNAFLFFLYFATGMPLFNNISHQLTNTAFNIYVLSVFFM